MPVDLVLSIFILVVWRSSHFGGLSSFVYFYTGEIDKTRWTSIITRPPDHQYKIRQNKMDRRND
jgi:hypothetical protein